MDQSVHNKLVSFIWSIADDCLRDVYVRGKYRDIILPMVVLRRLDALLIPTKEKVLEEVQFQKKEMKMAVLDPAGLEQASGYVFYNTSPWTLQKLHDTATNSSQILVGNFEEYLNGFSDNVKEIVEKFTLKEKVRHMGAKDVLLDVLEKFTSPYINLTPEDKEDPDGRKLPGLSNLGMGYVFEELIRRFNEENNEEAGEHFTPREVIDLMTHIVFDPIQKSLPPVMTIYDPACGSGGMLTESQNFIKDPEGKIKATGDVYLYGKEVNDETYAICKSDMMIKGNDPGNIKSGSTLSTDEFAGHGFDFMLSNPPYGKSWNSEVKNIKDGKEVIDPRFKVKLTDYWGNEEELDATPRTSDGQLLFLMEMIRKMKAVDQSAIGSRIASIHNGSSLFTGDAGSGESNIRRYIIDHDLLDTIIQLPNNLFYNTGITTYIWILSNNKENKRKGKVLLIDASGRYAKLRKNLGEKNCEFQPEHISEILKAYKHFKPIERNPGDDESIAAKVFESADFEYFKVTVERPKRLKAQFSEERIATLRFDKDLREPMEWAWKKHGDRAYDQFKSIEKNVLSWCDDNLPEMTKKQREKLAKVALWKKHKKLFESGQQLLQAIGNKEYDDFNLFREMVSEKIKELGLKLEASEKKAILDAVSWYDQAAAKVIRKRSNLKGKALDKLLNRLDCEKENLPDFGFYPADPDRGETDEYIEYEPESELRDYENVPFGQSIHEYFLSEVKPYIDEAWIDLEKTKIGCEISFNKHFYQPRPLRGLQEVGQEIWDLEKQSEGLISQILSC